MRPQHTKTWVDKLKPAFRFSTICHDQCLICAWQWSWLHHEGKIPCLQDTQNRCLVLIRMTEVIATNDSCYEGRERERRERERERGERERERERERGGEREREERERERERERWIMNAARKWWAVEIQLNVSLTWSHSQGGVRTQPQGWEHMSMSILMKLGLKSHSFVLSRLLPFSLLHSPPFIEWVLFFLCRQFLRLSLSLCSP